jgi:hypothetical protein
MAVSTRNKQTTFEGMQVTGYRFQLKGTAGP